MALTASKTSVGFEPMYHLFKKEFTAHKWLLTENTAFNKGDMVVLTNGRVAKAAASATAVLGVMAQSYTTDDNPDAKDIFGMVYDDPYIVYKCTFADHRDSTATGAGTTTTLIDSGIGGSDDDWNGAFCYIYEGGAAGELRVVKDYAAATGTLTFEHPLYEATTTASKYILLGAAAGVIGPGKNVNIKDHDTIDSNATTASDAGPLVIPSFGDYDEMRDLIRELMLPVMIRKHLFLPTS